MIKTSKIKLIIYGFLLATILSSCGEAPLAAETQIPIPIETKIPNPCAAEDISEFIFAIDDITKRFEDEVLLAENTSPEDLEPMIKEMVAIEKEFKNTTAPSCALRAKAALESYLFSKSQCHFKIYTVEGLGYTQPPEFEDKIEFLLNTEELASLYHLPLPHTETPNILWLTARHAPAPTNTVVIS